MSITIDFDNIIQIANDKTLSISTVKYGSVPSIKNVGTANDIKLEITIPPSEQDLDIEIGKVETGDTPTVKKRLDNGKIYFDFVLPTKGDQGEVGPQGDAATIEIGRVSIGNVAKVENVGTQHNAKLNFTLPYASGQGSYIPGAPDAGNTGSGSFGGDKETAEELKNVTAGINRSAKATEELETTIANILSQVTAMVEQNKIIIGRVVNQSEQLTKTLGDRIDANKLSIKAIQMTAIDRSMLDDTKARMASCEQTVSLLRGEIRQIFASEAYRADKKEITDKLDQLQGYIDTINGSLKALDDINDSIAQLSKSSTQDRADIDLMQSRIADLATTVAGKQDAGVLVTIKDLDAGLKNSIDAIAPIRITANQNTRKIADINTELNNLSTTLSATSQAIADVQSNYAEGDSANKKLIDNLATKFDAQTKVVNETIAEIQSKQSDAEDKFARASNVYTKNEVDNAIQDFMPKSGGTFSGNVKVNGSVTAESFTGRFVGNADSATTAGKATNDGEGNNIAETYVTKTSYNALASQLKTTSDRAEQAASQLETFTDRIESNAVEIDKLKSADSNFDSKIDNLAKVKADNDELIELRTIVDSNKKDSDTKRESLKSELTKFMLKDTVIPETQIDPKVIERFNGIDTNASAISQLQAGQTTTDAKVAKNTTDLASIKEALTKVTEEVEQTQQAIITPRRISLDTIKEMFAQYMPVEEEPAPEENQTADEGGEA